MSMQFGRSLLTYLSSLGLGLPASTRSSSLCPLWWMNMPSTPYTASLFVLTGGIDRRGNPVKLYSLSALHRNTQLSSGLSAISSIYSALNDEWNLVCPVEGRMSADTVPGSYTRDANDHYIFNLSFTFATVKKL